MMMTIKFYLFFHFIECKKKVLLDLTFRKFFFLLSSLKNKRISIVWNNKKKSKSKHHHSWYNVWQYYRIFDIDKVDSDIIINIMLNHSVNLISFNFKLAIHRIIIIIISSSYVENHRIMSYHHSRCFFFNQHHLSHSWKNDCFFSIPALHIVLFLFQSLEDVWLFSLSLHTVYLLYRAVYY